MNTISMRGMRALGALCMAWGALSATAWAEEYPVHPIKMVLPFPPGGGTDTLARLLAPKMSQELGQPVVIYNRPGASGNIATEEVVSAKPDGYTLLMGFNTALTVNPLLFKDLKFNVERDFQPITQLASAQYVLVVNKDYVKVTSVDQLIALAKSEPGKLNYSSSGIGSPLDLAAQLFKYKTGTDIHHIPYKGGGPATMALLGNEVQVLFGSVAAVMPHVHAGKFQALAVTGAQRSAVVPNLPTLAESGLPGFDVTSWYGLLAPKGTPRAVIDKLHAAALKAINEPEVRKAMAEQGLELKTNTPAQFATVIHDETGMWAELVKKMNIKLD
jgi:tripartite-type tricarboxylate transporter receptor subunit TctC